MILIITLSYSQEIERVANTGEFEKSLLYIKFNSDNCYPCSMELDKILSQYSDKMEIIAFLERSQFDKIKDYPDKFQWKYIKKKILDSLSVNFDNDKSLYRFVIVDKEDLSKSEIDTLINLFKKYLH